MAMPSEAAFTPPAVWCPNPSYWHAPDGQATEIEVTELAAAFVRALQPEVAVETGAYDGQTSQAIGEALARNGHGWLWTVELDAHLAGQTRQRCSGLPVTVVNGSSHSWQPPDGIGFAWIDGSGQRADEITHLLPHFAPGAILGMHDAGPQHPFLQQVQPLVMDDVLRPVVLRTPRGVLFAEVHQKSAG